MQRNDYHKIAEDFENELNAISRTIDDKKQALLEYQKELNTIQYKYNQRDE
jgi:archaellum component FlaC